MTTYYVGAGGNDANAGTSWAQRKLTLNAVEDIPVAAGDTVYVGPGTYRELLTVDVSGTAGNPISYIGDYLGTNTDGIGGVVRITGSDNDATLTRANCITATSRDYRTFQGFLLDGCTGNLINLATSCTGWIIDECYLQPTANRGINIAGTGTGNTVQNCTILGFANSVCISISHSSTVSNAGHIVQNCTFQGGTAGVESVRVGGITVKNCDFVARCTNGVIITTALTVGQTVTVNNCLIHGCATGLSATVLGEITANFNNIVGCTTARTNVAVGANDLSSLTMFDPRWFFQLVNAGAGPNSPRQLITLFDLSGSSPLINVAGTSPSATDMRGTGTIGAQREWGALEYDNTLKIVGILADGMFRRVNVMSNEWQLNQANRITFVMVDSNNVEVAGLGNGFTLEVSKNGGAFAASAGTKAEISNGWYSYLATAGEADTIGPVAIRVTGTGAMQQNLEYVVKQRNPGALAFTYTVTNSSTGLPVEGVEVWITTDSGGNNVIWNGHTDASGVARDDNNNLPYLDAGTYYFWKQKAGFIDAQNPDTEIVS